MELIGCEVEHKAFGNGVVVGADGKYLTVRFGTAEKKFVYPDAFVNIRIKKMRA